MIGMGSPSIRTLNCPRSSPGRVEGRSARMCVMYMRPYRRIRIPRYSSTSTQERIYLLYKSQSNLQTNTRRILFSRISARQPNLSSAKTSNRTGNATSSRSYSTTSNPTPSTSSESKPGPPPPSSPNTVPCPHYPPPNKCESLSVGTSE